MIILLEIPWGQIVKDCGREDVSFLMNGNLGSDNFITGSGICQGSKGCHQKSWCLPIILLETPCGQMAKDYGREDVAFLVDGNLGLGRFGVISELDSESARASGAVGILIDFLKRVDHVHDNLK